MNIDVARGLDLLQELDFKSISIEELGRSQAIQSKATACLFLLHRQGLLSPVRAFPRQWADQSSSV